MKTKYAERLAAIAEQHKALIAECNKVVHTATKVELDGYAERIKTLEKDYLKIRSQQVFGECPETLDAIKRHEYTTLGSKRANKDGVFAGYTIEDTKEQIDFEDYCDFYSLDKSWVYEAHAFGKRVALRVAKDIGADLSRVEAINNTYAMHKLAQSIELGEDPTSNTQMVKHLQTILDKLCPEAGKVNTHDVKYILYRVTKVSKKNLIAVNVATNNRIISAMVTAFYRVAVDGVYDPEFAVREGALTEIRKAKEEERSQKKAEKSSSGKVGGITRSKKKKEAVEAKEETVEVAKPEAKTAN